MERWVSARSALRSKFALGVVAPYVERRIKVISRRFSPWQASYWLVKGRRRPFLLASLFIVEFGRRQQKGVGWFDVIYRIVRWAALSSEELVVSCAVCCAGPAHTGYCEI